MKVVTGRLTGQAANLVSTPQLWARRNYNPLFYPVNCGLTAIIYLISMNPNFFKKYLVTLFFCC